MKTEDRTVADLTEIANAALETLKSYKLSYGEIMYVLTLIHTTVIKHVIK